MIEKLMKRWSECKIAESYAKEARLDVEAEMWLLLKEELKEEGSTTFKYENSKLTIKQDYTVKVHQELAEQHQEFFKKKYELSYSQFKKIPDNKLVLECITISPSKPSFEVVYVD